MREMQSRQAKLNLSEVLDAAERGEPTTITRHGKPVGVVVPMEDAKRIYADQRTLLEVLMSMPEDLEFVRDQTPLRAAKFD
jgi:prevent-host-death family protein